MFNFGKKKEVKAIEKFFEDNMHIFNPPSSFVGYEIKNESKENLTNICKVLTNNLVDMQKVNFEDKNEFVDSLVELKYITGDFQQQYNLVEIVRGINEIANNLNYSIKLSEKDVLDQDDETKKHVREKCAYLTSHDLNICAELLEQQGYELFQVSTDVEGYNMSLLPKSKIEELKQFTE